MYVRRTRRSKGYRLEVTESLLCAMRFARRVEDLIVVSTRFFDVFVHVHSTRKLVIDMPRFTHNMHRPCTNGTIGDWNEIITYTCVSILNPSTQQIRHYTATSDQQQLQTYH
jgi:hypothetical protein